MPSRRSVLATAVAVVGAGCSSSGESDVDPADHVLNDWHDEPERGLADTVTIPSNEIEQQRPPRCQDLAPSTVHEVIDERLDDQSYIVVSGCCRQVDGHEQPTVVERILTLNRDGEVVSSPKIEFQTVREATPRTVRAPEESDFDCEKAVFVVDSMEQLD